MRNKNVDPFIFAANLKIKHLLGYRQKPCRYKNLEVLARPERKNAHPMPKRIECSVFNPNSNHYLRTKEPHYITKNILKIFIYKNVTCNIKFQVKNGNNKPGKHA